MQINKIVYQHPYNEFYFYSFSYLYFLYTDTFVFSNNSDMSVNFSSYNTRKVDIKTALKNIRNFKCHLWKFDPEIRFVNIAILV